MEGARGPRAAPGPRSDLDLLGRVLPAAPLLAYGLAFAWTALGRGLLVSDDHPGQLYRVWHAVTLGPAPWRWNPGWWAGYPELQFYPPAFAYLGALLHLASARALSPEGAYQALLWCVFLLPGLSTYVLLARALGSGWLALPGALVAMTISAETRSGVEEGLRWGLVAARLGWGLLPLLALALVRWIEGRSRSPVVPAVAFAAIVLAHPAHAPLAVAMVLLALAVAPGPPESRAVHAGLVLGLGAGLTAFWLTPLVSRFAMTLPLAWGDASLSGLARRLVDYPLLAALAAATAAAWIGHARRPAADRAIGWLLALAPAAVGLVVVDAFLGELGARWLPADRVADGVVLALVLGASVGLAALARLVPALPPWGLALGAIACVVTLFPAGRNEPTLSLWPVRGQWPTYAEVVAGTRLDALWEALRRAPPGRVLFVRSSVPLEYRREWWRPHSHITALTPLRAGREIVNGTFTHPSPVAGFVYRGSPVAPITMLVEQRDGVTLFGTALGVLRTEQFDRLADAFRVSVVVALDEDADRLGFLGPGGRFGDARRVGPFLVFFSKVAVPLPVALEPGRVRLEATGTGPWIVTGLGYSPLWRARVAAVDLATRRGVTGLLEVERPRAADEVELRYGPGLPEWAGLALTAASALLLVVVAHVTRGSDPAVARRAHVPDP